MTFEGQFLKMTSVYSNPIRYYLSLSGDLLNINQLFGKKIHLTHTGYQCVNCGKNKPIYRMGFCKQCFFESPYASETIIRPELSRAHLGEEERDLEVEKSIQLQPHIVYLAYTGEVKVGVTRETQVPTRWIDQGATLALPVARTTNRYEAGRIEVELKKHLSDKTNYKKMLLNQPDEKIDLEEIRESVKRYFPSGFEDFYLDHQETVELVYPYQNPEKISVLTLDKTPEIEGILRGVKGQYIELEGDAFFNVRSHEGYVVSMAVE